VRTTAPSAIPVVGPEQRKGIRACFCTQSQSLQGHFSIQAHYALHDCHQCCSPNRASTSGQALQRLSQQFPADTCVSWVISVSGPSQFAEQGQRCTLPHRDSCQGVSKGAAAILLTLQEKGCSCLVQNTPRAYLERASSGLRAGTGRYSAALAKTAIARRPTVIKRAESCR